MGELLRIEKLNKNYGMKKVLKNVNLSIEKGRIVGLLGPNGIGKTTLLRTIADLQSADSGHIYIDGEKISSVNRNDISFLLDSNDYYKWMKVKDMIAWYVDFFPSFDIKKADKLIEQFSIDKDAKFRKLSKGNQERVCLMLALSRKAKIYLFDEPVGGLDPKIKKDIIGIILENIEEDATAIISSHLLRDLESLFDEIVIMNPNNIVHANVDDIREREGMSLEEFYIANADY